MRNYSEHYDKSREYSDFTIQDNMKYSSLYDLAIDTEFLDTNEHYHDIVKRLGDKIAYKLDNNVGLSYSADLAIYVNEWSDVPEIKEFTNYIMPQIERKIFHCNTHIQFVLPYRNLHNASPQASWLWHYDDCPNEFLKFVVYLNNVDEHNGCFQYIEGSDGVPLILSSRRTSPIGGIPQQLYKGSRIPPAVIQKMLQEGAKIKSLTGAPGTYAMLTPNMIHRATVPRAETMPRDCIFFFIRPSLKKRDSYINRNTYSILPKRNVKVYDLD